MIENELETMCEKIFLVDLVFAHVPPVILSTVFFSLRSSFLFHLFCEPVFCSEFFQGFCCLSAFCSFDLSVSCCGHFSMCVNIRPR